MLLTRMLYCARRFCSLLRAGQVWRLDVLRVIVIWSYSVTRPRDSPDCERVMVSSRDGSGATPAYLSMTTCQPQGAHLCTFIEGVYNAHRDTHSPRPRSPLLCTCLWLTEIEVHAAEHSSHATVTLSSFPDIQHTPCPIDIDFHPCRPRPE